MLGLDAVVPVVLIAAAVLMTLEPTIFGVAITEREIVLGFFGFLGIDALVERTGRLNRIERRLEALASRTTGPVAAGEVLRPRSSFDRMDMLVARARRSVLIIGVNLEGALLCVSTLLDLARAGGTVRLVAMDPDGTALGPAAAMSGVDPAVRRQKIIQNLELLRAEFTAHLDPVARGRVSLVVADLVLPLGAVGLDEQTRGGSLIVQHYLTATAAELAPLIWLRAETDQPWFSRYLAQCEACLAGAREWEGASACHRTGRGVRPPASDPDVLRPAICCPRAVLVARREPLQRRPGGSHRVSCHPAGCGGTARPRRRTGPGGRRGSGCYPAR
jgi:hypothetical protein